METAYKRVLLKISGEALAGDKKTGIDTDTVLKICDSIRECVHLGVEMGIVVGGGNFWRGSRSGEKMDRTRADHIGMLATVMNALALQDALLKLDIDCRVQSAVEMRQFCEPYIRNRAVRHLEKGRVVIFASGTGNPFFTTDTTAALRAAEIEAEVILLAKRIDGVYSDDPEKNPAAVKIDRLPYIEVINKGLGVMDATAASLCMDNKIPILVFGIKDPRNIVRVVMGERIGTVVD